MQFQVSQVGVFQPCQWEATPLPTEAIEQWLTCSFRAKQWYNLLSFFCNVKQLYQFANGFIARVVLNRKKDGHHIIE
jgi:hypothetical protein